MRFIEIESASGHEQSISKNLWWQHVRRICRARFQEFLNLIFRNRRGEPITVAPETGKKEYETPVVRKLTLEQAKLILIGHATLGDQGAKELMDLVFPEPNDVTGSPDATTAQEPVTRS